jgi:thioredoxin-related protein
VAYLQALHLLTTLLTWKPDRILKLFSTLLLLICTVPLLALGYSDDEEENSLPYVEIKTTDNLQELGRQALKQQKIIFLEMSASYCGYCKTLEENIIKPMLRSGDYSDYVLIRKLDIDSHYPIRDFDGNKTSPAQYAYKVNASLTPTLLFIDGRGNEVSERILGVNTLELFGQYVDDALLEGHRKIQSH